MARRLGAASGARSPTISRRADGGSLRSICRRLAGQAVTPRDATIASLSRRGCRRLRVALGKPVTVVGHSFGAGSATELALRHPDQLQGLVLVDAALGELDPQSEAPVAKVMRIGPIAQLTTSAIVTNPSALEPFLRSMIARKERAHRLDSYPPPADGAQRDDLRLCGLAAEPVHQAGWGAQPKLRQFASDQDRSRARLGRRRYRYAARSGPPPRGADKSKVAARPAGRRPHSAYRGSRAVLRRTRPGPTSLSKEQK